jgi:hypothetical protein
LLDQTTRIIPGDGVTPLVKILRKLARRVPGPLSVDCSAEVPAGDPLSRARNPAEVQRSCVRRA